MIHPLHKAASSFLQKIILTRHKGLFQGECLFCSLPPGAQKNMPEHSPACFMGKKLNCFV
jgi:hypothetical protein